MTGHNKDRNFDDIADKFTENIYATAKGQIRQTILWQDLHYALTLLPKRPLRILDAGGGNGVIACRLAQLGHQIILCDISAKMIELAKARAQQAGVSQQILFKHCAVQALSQHLHEPVDLILFHAVLEWVNEPKQALNILQHFLTKDGILSLMFYNYNGLLFRNIQLGNLGYINAGMHKKKRKTLSPDHPLLPQQVYNWLDEMQMTTLTKSGVRIFYDYLRDRPENLTTLLQLEQRYCQQEPFLHLGRYIHVLAQQTN